MTLGQDIWIVYPNFGKGAVHPGTFVRRHGDCVLATCSALGTSPALDRAWSFFAWRVFTDRCAAEEFAAFLLLGGAP